MLTDINKLRRLLCLSKDHCVTHYSYLHLLILYTVWMLWAPLNILDLMTS
jgi:hypothetical protein